jgi:hypothetical protein
MVEESCWLTGRLGSLQLFCDYGVIFGWLVRRDPVVLVSRTHWQSAPDQ